MNVDHINDLYQQLEQERNPNGDIAIRKWMLRCNITFDQLSFTEEELKTKMIRVMVLYINDLYKLFEHDPDPGGADIIREWMQQHHITFDLLDFSEEELEAKKAMSLDRLH